MVPYCQQIVKFVASKIACLPSSVILYPFGKLSTFEVTPK
uniref:MICOS complex subunit n=1 Tax=Heterorhabditis bacteriophora TaxID=37862 RepID=A0A1I7WAQ1_HETBA